MCTVFAVGLKRSAVRCLTCRPKDTCVTADEAFVVSLTEDLWLTPVIPLMRLLLC